MAATRATTTEQAVTSDYQQQLGDRLRSIRRQQGLTLQDVEERSEGVWKAVVIGSYERGDRAVSVPRLAALAAFYGVPVGELLPSTGVVRDTGDAGDAGGLVLDLTGFEPPDVAQDGRLGPVVRFARDIQRQRGDYNGRVLTLRRDDLRALASALGEDAGELVSELSARRLVRTA